MKGYSIYLPLVLVLMLCGFFMRVGNLDYRPMHHDEANQALKFGELLESGHYQYDANDHHGPSMYYFTLPLAWADKGHGISEMSETSLRMLQVLFGSALIFLVYFFRDALGGPAVLYAAALTALSPVMNYYSRFYIQEIILVFFTFSAICTAWRYRVTGKFYWALMTGLSLGLMYSTKETAVIAWLAFVMGLLFAWVLSGRKKDALDGLSVRHIVYSALAAFFVAFLFFSSFFTNMKGPVDSVMAYFTYAERAGGLNTEHIQPWYFYLRRIAYYKVSPLPAWSEWVICLFGCFGIIYSLFSRKPCEGERGPALFMAVYTLSIIVIYSAISYKTPWCVLSMHHALIIMAGYGMAVAVRLGRNWWMKAGIYGLILFGCLHLAAEAGRTNLRFSADHRNPWVYAQTGIPYKKLVDMIDDISGVSKEGRDMFVAVIAPPQQTWPLPWSLRKYTKTGFWTDAAQFPIGYSPAIVIASEETDGAVSKMFKEGYRKSFYGLRYDTMLVMYIRNDLWDSFIETRQ